MNCTRSKKLHQLRRFGLPLLFVSMALILCLSFAVEGYYRSKDATIMAKGFRGYLLFLQGNVYMVNVHVSGEERPSVWLGTYSSSFGRITVYDKINDVTLKGVACLFGIWWGGQEGLEYFIWRTLRMRGK